MSANPQTILTGSRPENWLDGEVRGSAGGDLSWLAADRGDAQARARARGMPDARQEAWRYTSLKALAERDFAPRLEPPLGISRGDLEGAVIAGLEAQRAVLVDGWFMPQLSDLSALPPGVRAGSLRSILAEDPDAVACHLNKLAKDSDRLFTDINTAAMEDGFVLLLDAGVRVEQPIEVLHLSVGSDRPRVAQPRLLVALGEGARALLVERYASIDDPQSCTNTVLELFLEQDSELDHYRIQTESTRAFHICGFHLRQAANSRYKGLNLGLGATWSRTDLGVQFAGPGAEAHLDGLFLAGDGQLMDYHLDVDHRIGHCASRERFKGILYGKGRAVFDGRVHVARDAQKTDAHLSNKNLILSRSAEVDTKPQLEIFADDVKCSHGTTVGQLDPQALFYLRSRGIPQASARRMLCLGFAGEIIDAIGPEPLREYAAAQVGLRLDKAPLE